MSPRPRREEQHPDLRAAIIQTAWQQIAENGAPALSLRAIARALNITAPSIYNYFPSRDDLVTALIVEAFLSFGDTQAAAISSIPQEAYSLRLQALGIASREWAVTYPERYQLIFGTPIARYEAPAEITMPAAARSLTFLVDVLSSAQVAGKLRLPDWEMTPSLRAMFHAWQQARGYVDERILFLTFIFWGQVHGLVSLEIGHQFPPFITDAGEIYRKSIDILIAQYLL